MTLARNLFAALTVIGATFIGAPKVHAVVVYSQNFDSLTVPALPASVTTPHGTFVTTTSNPVSSPNALVASPAVDGSEITFQGFTAIADQDVRIDTTIADSIPGILLRSDTSAQNAYAVVQSNATFTTFDVYKIVGGSASLVANIPTGYVGSNSSGAKISIRTRVQGSTIETKVWPYGTTEPSSWGGSTTDGAITAAGYVGIYYSVSAGGGSTIDNLSVDDLTTGPLTAGTSSSSNVGSTTLTVTNTGGAGGTSPYTYQWYRSTTSGFTPGGGNIVSGATSLTLNDTGLTASTTYFYKNVVTDNVGATATATQLSVTTNAALANGTLSSSGIGSTTATVVDAGASGGTSPYTYQWYRSTTSGFTPGGGNIVSGATATTLNDTGLTASTTYYYKNVVTDHVGGTAISSQLSLTTSSSGTLANGTLSQTSVGTTTASIVDTGASGGTSPYTYQWYRSTTSGFTPGAGNIVSGATSLTLNDTGLTASTTYFYKNVVTDNVGATSTSAQLSVTTTAALANGTLSSSGSASTTATVVDAGASGGTSPYTYQWYRSTTSGFTPGGGNIVSGATSTTLNDTGLTPSTTYYYKNIVTDNVGATATSSQLSVTTTSSGPTTIGVTNAALFWSPGNWDHLASGTFGVSTDTMQATAAGAYLKFVVTGTASVTLKIDNATNSSFPTGDMPVVRYSINGAAFVDAQLAPSATTYVISSSLTTSSTYSIEVYFKQSSSTNGYADVWGSSGVSPTNVLRISGVVIDNAATVSAPTLRAKRMLMYGDSITAAEHANLDGSDDATQGFAPALAQALGAEYGQLGYGGQGYQTTGGSNAIPFGSAWNLYSAGRSRSFSGYDYVAIVHGGNDARGGVGGSSIQSDLATLLPAMRTALGTNTIIFVFVECMGSYSSDLSAAVTAYKTSSGDAKVFFVDGTSLLPTGVFTLTFGSTTQWTYDGVHPLIYGHARIGAVYSALAAAALQPANSNTNTFRRNGTTGGFNQ